MASKRQTAASATVQAKKPTTRSATTKAAPSSSSAASSSKTPASKAIAPSTAPKTKKRARGDHDSEELQQQQETQVKKTKKIKAGDTPDETRLRRFRPKPPQSFYDIYERARTQRFFVLGRERCGSPDCPEETVELAGSTGNVYTVRVSQVPSCDCPHGEKGNQCKHLLYVMSRVLRARFDLVYQLALLRTELQEIFAAAPPILDLRDASTGEGANDKRRKPVEGDCPICFDALVGDGEDGGESLVWCRAACGQNMHRLCLQTWTATKGQRASCPLCRSEWEGDEDVGRSVKRDGPVNEEGYVNVAEQLGISTERDYSSYSSWFGRSSDRQYYGQGRRRW